MLMTWNSVSEWARLVKSGHIRLTPGQHLSHKEMAALGAEPFQEAPLHGSLQATDALQATRHLRAAATTQQRAADLAAAAVPGDAISSIAGKLQASWKRSKIWESIEAQETQSMLTQARTDTRQAIAASIQHAAVARDELPSLGSKVARAIHRQYENADVSQRGSGSNNQQLAGIQEQLDRLIALLEQHLGKRIR